MSRPRDHELDGFAWREQGEGRLVLFLHGLGGSRVSWEPQLDAIGRHRRAVAWDMPGYGAAAPLPDDPPTFAALAAAAARCITVLGEPAAHVVGISMGGMIAQYLAAWHPECVRSLTLLSTSPAFGLDGTDPAAWASARLAPLDEGLQPADYAPRVVDALAAPDAAASAKAGQVAAMARVPAVALRRSIAVLPTHDSRALLPGIQAPTLVMVGSLDRETPPSYSEQLVALLPHATLQVVPGAGHLLNAEAPVQVNDAILRHLERVEHP